MNEKYIVSFNVAGFAWTATNESWVDRLRRTCDYLRKDAPDAWLIGLSEVLPGRDNKYIDLIKNRFPDYIIVLPKAYKNNYRSAINILLINREGYLNHNTRTLDGLEDSLLYNYVGIDTSYGYYRVLNAHIPHTCNKDRPGCYQKEREQLRVLYEQSVYETCMTYRREPDIQFIFMTDANASPESPFIQKLSGSVNPPLFNATRIEDMNRATWINSRYMNIHNHLDYIFYSMGTVMAPVIDVYYNDIIDAPITQKLSDHALVRGRIQFNYNRK
ncbi:hypothetical protein ACTNBM_13375 [Lachnospiraceae bacterium HCP1S3_C3]